MKRSKIQKSSTSSQDSHGEADPNHPQSLPQPACTGVDMGGHGGDLYRVLGVSKTATAKEIRKAYKKKALEWSARKHANTHSLTHTTHTKHTVALYSRFNLPLPTPYQKAPGQEPTPFK